MINLSVWGNSYYELVEHLRQRTGKISDGDVNNLVKFLNNIRSREGILYLIAAGRSMDVLRIFGARLRQIPIKLQVKSFMDTFKQKLANSDAILILTGTGETHDVNKIVKEWDINNQIALISSKCAASTHTEIFDLVEPEITVLLSGIEPRDIEWKRNNSGRTHPPLFDLYNGSVPGPTKFEIESLVFLESIIAEMYREYRDQDSTEYDYTHVEMQDYLSSKDHLRPDTISQLDDILDHFTKLLSSKEKNEREYQTFLNMVGSLDYIINKLRTTVNSMIKTFQILQVSEPLMIIEISLR